MSTNPLFMFRKPERLARQSGETHFNTQREDVSNDTGITNIYPGDFTYKLDPTLEIDFGSWEDFPDPKSYSQYVGMTRDGWNPALAKEFAVSERLALVWKKDAGGRLTLGGKTTGTMVLMWRTAERAEQAQKRRLQQSDSVQKSPEEVAAEAAERNPEMTARGVKLKLSIEDEE